MGISNSKYDEAYSQFKNNKTKFNIFFNILKLPKKNLLIK